MADLTQMIAESFQDQPIRRRFQVPRSAPVDIPDDDGPVDLRDEDEAHQKAWDTRGRGSARVPGHNVTSVNFVDKQEAADASYALFGSTLAETVEVAHGMVVDSDDQFTIRIDGDDSPTLRIRMESDWGSTLERTFSEEDGQLVVHHDWFTVSDSEQGKGTAKDILRGSFQEYERIGVARVDVTANIDAGAYAWGRFGFLPTSESWSKLRGTLETRSLQHDMSDEQRALVDEVVKSADPKTMWRLVDSPVVVTPQQARAEGVPPGTKFAKLLLANARWNGSIDLKNTAQMARLKYYLGKKEDPEKSRTPVSSGPRQKSLPLGDTDGK